MIYYPTYLVHHGIKGQQWGIRRYQNEDGTWTEEGRRRYGEDLKSLKTGYKESKKEYKRLSKQFGKRSEKAKEAYANIIYNKRQRSDLKNIVKMNRTKKDKRQLKYEDEYIKKGMNKEDAELQAYKKRKTEKILLATAGVAAAAAAGVAAYKIYNYNADKIIRKGTKFHRVVADGSYEGVEDAFVAKNLYDRKKYTGMYAKWKKEVYGADKAIKDLTIEAQGDVKIASRKNAKNMLKDVLKRNPEMVDELKKQIEPHALYQDPKVYDLMVKAKKDLSKGKVTDKVYDAFNYNFVGGNKDKGVFREFRETMNRKGYGAMLDMNDKKYSGYDAINPLILIDRNNKFSVKDIKEVSQSQIIKDNKLSKRLLYAKYSSISLAKSLAPAAIGGTAGAITGASIKKSVKSNNDKLVAKYQKEHPGTKKTYNEILRDIYKR